MVTESALGPCAPAGRPPDRLSDDQAAELGRRVARALLREHGGWARTLRAARAEGLDTLVGLAFEKGALSPPGHLARAAGAVGGEAGRIRRFAAAAVQESALAVLRELEAAGVTCAAIKGFATAPRYGRFYLRRIADVDLLARPRDLARAEGVLLRRGYRVAKRDAIEVSFERAPVTPSGERALLPAIDLHVRLSYEGQFDFDIDEMLERASRMDSIPVLSPEDAVLVASSDAARDCFVRAGRSITDVAVLAMTSELDWDAVAERARRYGLTAAVWVALTCARRALTAPVPADVLRRFRPSLARAVYLGFWLDTRRLSPYRLTSRATTRADLRFAMAALWPILIDGPWRRAAFVASYAALKLRSLLGATGTSVP